MPIVKSNEIQLNIQFFQLCSFNHFLYQAGNTHNPSQPLRASLLGWSKIIFCSRIEPTFFSSMCIGHTKPHTKFQDSGLNILSWRPLFVNVSWSPRKSFKMTWKVTCWPCLLEVHQNSFPKWYNTWGLRVLEVC